VHPEEIEACPSPKSKAIDFSYARDLNCTIRQIAAPVRA